MKEEDDEEEYLDEVSQDICQGKWLHSGGDSFSVRNDTVTFDNGGGVFTLVPAGNTMMLDGWKANPSKSTRSEILWEKEGQDPCTWTFEFDLTEDGAVDLEELETSNILESRTRRRASKPDYATLNRIIPREQRFGGDDDDDDDEEHQEPGVEEEAQGPLKRRKVAGSSSAAPAVVPLSPDELVSLRRELECSGKEDFLDSKAAMAVFNKLSAHSMTYEDLKASKVGKEVNRYRKHKDAAVAQKAKVLIKKYVATKDAAKGKK